MDIKGFYIKNEISVSDIIFVACLICLLLVGWYLILGGAISDSDYTLGYMLLIIPSIIIITIAYINLHRSPYFPPSHDSIQHNIKYKSRLIMLDYIIKGAIVCTWTIVSIIIVIILYELIWYKPPTVTLNENALGNIIMEEVLNAIIVGFILLAALILFLLTYLGYFFLPSFLSLPFAIFVGNRWKYPGRFLLLRPFNRKNISRILKKIIRKEVAYWGHIYTLADMSIKIPLYIRIPIFIGQLAFFHFKMLTIKNEYHLKKLQSKMGNRWLRNINWCMSWNKIFPVRTVDEFWKTCILRMISDVDVILIDLSELRESIGWEIEQCKKSGLSERIIFMVQEGRYDFAKKYLYANVVDGSNPIKLYQYSSRGLISASSFQSEICNVLTQGERAKPII